MTRNDNLIKRLTKRRTIGCSWTTVSSNSCVVAIDCLFLSFLVCVDGNEIHWLETMEEVRKADEDDDSVGLMKNTALIAVRCSRQTRSTSTVMPALRLTCSGKATGQLTELSITRSYCYRNTHSTAVIPTTHTINDKSL